VLCGNDTQINDCLRAVIAFLSGSLLDFLVSFVQMETDAIQKQIAAPESANEERDNDSHLAHIPSELHDNVIELTSVPLDTGSSLTVMLGILNPSYSSAMWQTDAVKWSTRFPKSNIINIKLRSVRGSPNVLDTADAADTIKAAIEAINSIKGQSALRIILLGPGYASFLPVTIKHLLKEWKTEKGEEGKQKKLNLVISNTTQVDKYFDFCKELCLTGFCHSVQFYNTDYYYPFGYYYAEKD
jgi:hypothetical protein